ncbi:hypothetical protein Tco_0267788 [Tanacetum coccineum]
MYPTGPFQTFTTPASGSSGQKTSFTRCLLRRNNTMTYYFCLNMDTGAEAGEVALIYNNADFLTRRVLLRCDSTGDLYPVTSPSPIPHAFLVSQHTWHQRLGHLGGEVLRRLVSSNFISCIKRRPPGLCVMLVRLGKHVKLPFVSSDTMISSCFEIIHSDVWTLPILSLLGPRHPIVTIPLLPDFGGVTLTLDSLDVLCEVYLQYGFFSVREMVLRVENKLFVIDRPPPPISLASPTDSEYLCSEMRSLNPCLRNKLEWSGLTRSKLSMLANRMRENQLHMSLDEELCGTGMS